MNKTILTEIAQKLNVVISSNKEISIKNQHDIGDLILFLGGYKNEADYFSKTKVEEDFILTGDKPIVESCRFFSNIDTAIELTKLVKDLPEHKSTNINNIRSNNVSSFNIGESVSFKEKNKEQFYLPLKNTLIVTDSDFFISNIQKLLANQNIFFTTLSDSSETKIDLINSLVSSESFEEFISSLEHDNLNYNFIWSLIVKSIKDSFSVKMTPDFILNSFRLDTLCDFYFLFRQTNPYLSKIIYSYLKSIVGLEISDNLIKLTPKSYTMHNQTVNKIYNFFLEVREEYEDGLLSSEGLILEVAEDFLRQDAIQVNFKNKNTYIAFNKLVNFLKLNTKNIQPLLLCLDNNIHINNSDFVVFSIKAHPTETELLIAPQIIFGKNTKGLFNNPNFINKFVTLTPILENNIFSYKNNFLSNLPEDSFYIWRPKDKKPQIIEEFSFDKIKLS